jgi:hypothetical protein
MKHLSVREKKSREREKKRSPNALVSFSWCFYAVNLKRETQAKKRSDNMCAYVLHQKRKREVNSINTFWCFGQFSFITKLYIYLSKLSLSLSLSSHLFLFYSPLAERVLISSVKNALSFSPLSVNLHAHTRALLLLSLSLSHF